MIILYSGNREENNREKIDVVRKILTEVNKTEAYTRVFTHVHTRVYSGKPAKFKLIVPPK